MRSTGVYFYAISRGLDPARLQDQTGIDDAPLRLVDHAGLVAVVSDVDLEEFGEEGLRRNLEDLQWLEAVALAHDRVARFASQLAPSAPLRLATVLLSEDAVRDRLAEWHQAADEVLRRIEGRGEWSVKLYVDPVADAADENPAAAAEVAGPGAGKAYLMRRKAATAQREQSAERDAEVVESVHAELGNAAVASRRLAPQDKRLTGHTGEMLLNGTYLVPDESVEQFKAAVEELAGRHAGVRMELGGPWPPYSFATLEET